VPGRPTFFDVSKVNQTIPKYTFWSRDDARNSGGQEGNFTHVTNGFNRNPGARPPVRPPANNFRPGSQTHSLRGRTAAATDHLITANPPDFRTDRQHGQTQAMLTVTSVVV